MITVSRSTHQEVAFRGFYEMREMANRGWAKSIVEPSAQEIQCVFPASLLLEQRG